jgi:hypothetical protein
MAHPDPPPPAPAAAAPLTAPTVLLCDRQEVLLLRASVGFHAKALNDPDLRERLYRLWCRLDEKCQPADTPPR